MITTFNFNNTKINNFDNPSLYLEDEVLKLLIKLGRENYLPESNIRDWFDKNKKQKSINQSFNM